jgi:hypothetical protein
VTAGHKKLAVLRSVIREYVRTALGGQTLVANGPTAGDRDDELVSSGDDVKPSFDDNMRNDVDSCDKKQATNRTIVTSY